MIEIKVVNAFSSLGIILNTKGGLEKYKTSSMAKSNHAVIAVMLGQNTKLETMCDQMLYKVEIQGPEEEWEVTDMFQGTFHEKVLRIPGCVVNAVADLDLGSDIWRGEICLVRQMGKELARDCYEWQVGNIKFGSRATHVLHIFK